MFARAALTGLAVLALTACPDKEAKPTGVSSLEELKAAGKVPIQFQSASGRIVSVGGGKVFDAKFKNLLDQPVSMFKSTVLLVDANGKLCPDGESESGYGEMTPLKPGEEFQLSLMAPEGCATGLKVVVKEVMYEVPNPLGKNMGTLTMKWANPAFDAELAKARGAP